MVSAPTATQPCRDQAAIATPRLRRSGHSYDIGMVVASGANAVVMGAIRLPDRKPVVIKAPRDGGAAGHRGLVREAQALAMCRHPRIPRLLDIDSLPDQRPVLILERRPGATLAQSLINGEPLSLPPMCIAYQLATTLADCHDRGVVHRDCHPGNILIDESGISLLDFDQARIDLHNGPDHNHDRGFGTPPFAAPEQERDATTAGPPCDAHALGVLMTQLGLARHPTLAAWIERLRNKRPERRPSCRTIAGLLAGISRLAVPQPTAARPRSYWWRSAVGFAAAGAILAVAGMWNTSRPASLETISGTGTSVDLRFDDQGRLTVVPPAGVRIRLAHGTPWRSQALHVRGVPNGRLTIAVDSGDESDQPWTLQVR